MATILLTGASAFSGLWIAEALAADGHHVLAPLFRGQDAYAGIRRDRVTRLGEIAEIVFDASFATPRFCDLIRSRRPSVMAHHAAQIHGYRDPEYDPIAGLMRNVAGAREVIRILSTSGAEAIITTGTSFEIGEGGAAPLDLAVTRYGLSQSLVRDLWRHETRWAGLAHGRFVIPAPFGVLEEGRLVWSLFQSWFDHRPAFVRAPTYVRDNVPAPLLGDVYSRLVSGLLDGKLSDVTARPSGFVGTQADFAQRVATEVEARLNRPCPVELNPSPEVSEPGVRVNSETCIPEGWDERPFWDSYVQYYLGLQARGLLSSSA